MNPNAIPKTDTPVIIDDADYLPLGLERTNPTTIVEHVLNDGRFELKPDYVPYYSNTERKKMLAREHNRAYTAGELNRRVDLKDIVREAVSHAEHSLGLPVTQSVLRTKR